LLIVANWNAIKFGDNIRSIKFTLGDVTVKTPNSIKEAPNSILNKFFNLQGVKIETTIPLEVKNFRFKELKNKIQKFLIK